MCRLYLKRRTLMFVFRKIFGSPNKKRMPSTPMKMVLVVRKDLKMNTGKIAAQCCHAAIRVFESAKPWEIDDWVSESGSKTICLQAPSEKNLMACEKAARKKGLNCCVIRDAGRTQIDPFTRTVLAIGPGKTTDINEVTGKLSLL